MNTDRLGAVALIIAGALGLAYGGHIYSRGHQEIEVRSMSVAVSARRAIPVPVWAGLAAVLVGTGLLLSPAVER